MKLEVIVSPWLLDFGKPEFATDGAAAIDLRALLNSPLTKLNYATRTSGDNERGITSIMLAPGEQVTIDSGLRIHINSRTHAGLILPRSSSGKKGLVLANGTGLIDSDYQGPLLQMLWNRGHESIEIKDGDRVAQYVLTNVFQFDMKFVDAFSDTSERGEGGFGSTGAN
jgi:dUTP pyrophosphatase